MAAAPSSGDASMAGVHSAVDKAVAAGAKAASAASSATSSKACALDGACLDLNALRADNKRELVELLDSLPGRKCLVLDSALGGRLNHVVVEGARLLREHGVSYFRELRGDDVGAFPEDDQPDHVIYLVRAHPPNMAKIAKHVKSAARAGHVVSSTKKKKTTQLATLGKKDGGDDPARDDAPPPSTSGGAKGSSSSSYHVVMLPRATFMCRQLLEDAMVSNYVEIHDLHVDLVAYEKDVLSLEMEPCFADAKVHGDPTYLEFAATAWMKFENHFGRAETVRTIGPAARAVAARVAKFRRKLEILKLRERGCYAPVTQRIFGSALPPPMPDDDWPRESQVDTVVFIDRECDLVSPLVTPLTYEGLVDELIGPIRNAGVKLPDDVVNGDGKATAKKYPKPDGYRDPFGDPPLNRGVWAQGFAKGPPKGVPSSAAAEDSAPSESAEEQKKQAEKTKLVAVTLNSNDPLFGESRDLNIERLGAYLGERAKAVRGSYDTFRSNKDASITEIHEFVKRIPSLTQYSASLQTHINIVEVLKRTTDGKDFRDLWHTERAMLEGDVVYENLEDRIGMMDPPMQVLRLLCLQAVTQGGIRGQTKFDVLRREVIQTYGFELLGTLWHLEKAGLFYKRKDVAQILGGAAPQAVTAGLNTLIANTSGVLSGVSSTMGGGADASAFAALRRHLKLIVDDVDPRDPQDAAYVTSGYAPLSVRLVELTARANSWAPVAAALPYLPGPALQYRQVEYTVEELDKLMTAVSPTLAYGGSFGECAPPPNVTPLLGGSQSYSVAPAAATSDGDGAAQTTTTTTSGGGGPSGQGIATSTSGAAAAPAGAPTDDASAMTGDKLKKSSAAKKAAVPDAEDDVDDPDPWGIGGTPLLSIQKAIEEDERQRRRHRPKPGNLGKPVLVVFYVGGVTYAEIAALRFVASRPGFPYSLLILTTSIINGSTFLKSLVYEIENKMRPGAAGAAAAS